MKTIIPTPTFNIIPDNRPNDYEYAVLSEHVYGDIKQGDILKIKNEEWEVIQTQKGSNDYFGVLYKNESRKQFVLVHRGTKSLGGIFEDLQSIILKKLTAQHEVAYGFTKEVVEQSRANNFHLSTTGHSLGALLAELSTYWCHDQFAYYDINAVTFESPGADDLIENKFLPNLKNNRIDFRTLDIVQYLSYPNLINTWAHHIGTVYQIQPMLGDLGWVLGWYTKQAHSMSNIVEIFEKENNSQPSQDTLKTRILMQDWPLGSERTKFFDQAIFLNGRYSLQELESNKEFELFYKVHYTPAKGIDDKTQLLLRHFNLGIKEFLSDFFQIHKHLLKEEKTRKALVAYWENEKVPDAIINLILHYTIEQYKNTKKVTVLDGQDVQNWRKDLGLQLAKHPNVLSKLLQILKQENINNGIIINIAKTEYLDDNARKYIEDIHRKYNITTSADYDKIESLLFRCIKYFFDRTAYLMSVVVLVVGAIWCLEKFTDNAETAGNSTQSHLQQQIPTNSIDEIKKQQFYGNIWIRNKYFTGREQVLVELDRLLTTNDVVEAVVLGGFFGIGKSQIANEYLHQSMIAKKYDAAIWIDASNVYTISQSYMQILKTLDPNTESKEEELSIHKLTFDVHNKLSKSFKNILIVLDNLSNDDKNFYRYYTDLYRVWQDATNSNVRIIITSTKSSWDKIATIQVNDFSIEEIREYIRKLNAINHIISHDIIENTKVLHTLYKVFGGLPLIISQAMKYVQDNDVTVEDLIKTINHNPGMIFNYPTYISDNYSTTQLSLLNFTVKQVIDTNSDAAELLYILSFLGDGKIPKKMLHKYFQDINRYQQAYRLLKSKSLLVDDGEYCKMHKVLQLVVKNIVTDQNLISDLYSTTIDVLLTCLDFNIKENYSLVNVQKAIYSSTILNYISHIQSVFNYYEKHGLQNVDKNKLMILTRILGEYHRSRRSGELAIDIWNFNVQHWDDKEFEIIDLINISEAYMQTGNYDKALPYVHKLLSIVNTNDKKAEYVTALKIIGSINLHIGQHTIAKLQIQQAIDVFDKSVGSEYELIYLKNMLALVTMYTGEYNKALSILLECEDVFKRNNALNHFVRIFVTNNIGFCKEFLGVTSEARDYFQKSYELAQLHENTNLSSHSIILTPLSNLGIIDLLQDKFMDAEDKLSAVLQQTERYYNTLPVHTNNLVVLGYYYYALGEYRKSFEVTKRAESILKARKPTFHYLMSTLLLHNLYEASHEYELSIHYLRHSLDVASNIFGHNACDALSYHYSKYFTWKNNNTNYDEEYIRYLNKAMDLSITLFGREHAEVFKYMYFKALYYISNGNMKIARELLVNMPLLNGELITPQNAVLINHAFSTVKNDTK